ncbi:MAG: phospholipase [Gemmatimonadota bacterium]|nr:phospholipase [Gemmatimonadota bacterium]
MSVSRRGFLATTASALALPTAWACGRGFIEPGVGDPQLSARPGDPTVPPSVGSTRLGLGNPRDGYLWVPAGYAADTPAPLVVALHGAGQSADLWDAYRARADARGFVLLAPESRGNTWDIVANRTFGPDVAFIDRALAFAFDRCRIDPARLALAGFSDGASCALSLGVSNGDLFTHLIAYSPGFLYPTEPIVGTPPVFISHGTADPILPFHGTRDDVVPRLRDAGYTVNFQSFDGGHTIPAEISELALDWFLA